MIVFHENDDYEPLTWVRGLPVYATTLLVAGHVAAFFVILLASGPFRADWPTAMVFSGADVLHRGAIWEWATYFLVNRRTNPLFFAIEMVFFYVFGREVERYIGRRRYLLLYGSLILIPPIFLTFLTLLGGTFPATLEGSSNIHFAIFLTFAKLHPGVEFFLRIRAGWLALGLLALYVVMDIGNSDWGGLCAILADAGTVWLFIAWLQGTVPTLASLWSRWGFFAPRSSVPKAARAARAEKAAASKGAPQDPMEAIDPLLDKIARDGMESLTPEERESLEKARKALLGKSPAKTPGTKSSRG